MQTKSVTQPQKTIMIESITLTAEDLAQFDQILGQLPYRTVRPLYDIINKRMVEAGELIQAQEDKPKFVEELSKSIDKKNRAKGLMGDDD